MTLDNRQSIAARAVELVGGEDGFTKSHDPLGMFKLVTEGRQATWKDASGKKHTYSSCEDLASRLALEACDLKRGMIWCNRVDGGNSWIPGQNLLRIKRFAGYAWHQHRAHDGQVPKLGDVVQVKPALPHTFAISAVEYDGDRIVSFDTCDYGQFLEPPGAPKPDHGCCQHLERPAELRNGKLYIGGREVIGWLDLLQLRARELTDPKEPDVGSRTLRLQWPRMTGKDVGVVQTATGAAVDDTFGPQTDRCVRRFQSESEQGLTVDGIVGPLTWNAILKR